MNTQTISNRLRKENEIKAIKTIGATVMLYFVCYLPAVIYGYLLNNSNTVNLQNKWFEFFCMWILYVPGFLNPIVFALRTKRFRRALRQLVLDPLGVSEIVEPAKKFITTQRPGRQPRDGQD